MKMANKAHVCLAAALLCFAAQAFAAAKASTACVEETTGYSPFFGMKKTGAKFIDHTQLMKQGPIKQVSLYFNKPGGCLRGAKAVFGATPTPGVIGTSANTTETALKLKEGEFITKAEYKAKKCIEYVKLYTNAGRSVSVGSAASPAALATSAANKTSGHLVAIRGFQGQADGKPGPLQQLQFVWGSSNKCPSSAGAALIAESGTVTVSSVPPITTSSSSSSSSGVTTTVVTTNQLQAAGINTNPAQCSAKPDMCNEKASMNQFSYCIWNAPHVRPSCKGGCCFSSGKCASSSCAISGMGRDVANMICYGTNSGFGFGGSNLCAGLACKLAVPGCTTDAFGGNCVGTVVALNSASEVHPDSAKFLGAACLDATPSDTTLDVQGNPAGTSGVYMGKLWTICDCSDSQGASMPETAARLLNLTTSPMSNLTKNDVLLAISQLLPKVNLTEALSPEKESGTELFPSFTDFFKMPALPAINLPSILSNGSSSSSSAHSSNSSVPSIQLPDLATLLGQLASKVNTTAAAAQTKAAEVVQTTPTAASTATPTNATAALAGIKDLLAKFVPGLANANLSTSSSSSNSNSPAATPAVAIPAVAATPAVATTPAATPESGTITPASAVQTAAVPAAAVPVTVAAVPAVEVPVAVAAVPAAETPVTVAAVPAQQVQQPAVTHAAPDAPEATPEAAPEAAPAATPQATPEATPQATPEPAPEATQAAPAVFDPTTRFSGLRQAAYQQPVYGASDFALIAEPVEAQLSSTSTSEAPAVAEQPAAPQA